VLKTLEGFGFARLDAEVYVYLAKKGPQNGTVIAEALKIRKQQLYPVLINLQNRGLVTTIFEMTQLFSAITFEKALDLLVKANIEQAKAIKETKEELLSEMRDRIERENI
jgi:sugar-specific transcriptional regulator TrmB